MHTEFHTRVFSKIMCNYVTVTLVRIHLRKLKRTSNSKFNTRQYSVILRIKNLTCPVAWEGLVCCRQTCRMSRGGCGQTAPPSAGSA